MKRSIKLLLALLLADALIVLLHLSFGPNNIWFHLDFERNLPTYYQSLKLILAGSAAIYFLLIKPLKNKTMRYFLLPLSLALTALGFDELLEIHENIYLIFEKTTLLHPSNVVSSSAAMGYQSSLWIIYYLPILFFGVLWLGYWLGYFHIKYRANFYRTLVVLPLVMTVIGMELISSTGLHTDSVYFWMVTIEEGAELLVGTSIIYLIYASLDHPKLR